MSLSFQKGHLGKAVFQHIFHLWHGGHDSANLTRLPSVVAACLLETDLVIFKHTMGTLPVRQPGLGCSSTAELTLDLVDRINSPGMSGWWIHSPQGWTRRLLLNLSCRPLVCFVLNWDQGWERNGLWSKPAKLNMREVWKSRATEGGPVSFRSEETGHL